MVLGFSSQFTSFRNYVNQREEALKIDTAALQAYADIFYAEILILATKLSSLAFLAFLVLGFLSSFCPRMEAASLLSSRTLRSFLFSPGLLSFFWGFLV